MGMGISWVWGNNILRKAQQGSGGMHLSFQLQWEAEMGRIMVPGQSRQESLQDPISMEKSQALVAKT
jgi:hypothetical protein